MKKKLFCPVCEKEVTFTEKHILEKYPVKGEDTVINAVVSYCDCCGSEIWNEEQDAKNLLRAFNAYREAHHLLLPEKIKSIREKYGLSQSTFSRALGLGEKTITRYERGSIQDRAHNGLISLADKPDAFLLLVEQNKELLSDGEYNSIISSLGRFEVKVFTSRKPVSYSTSQANYFYYEGRNYFGGLNNAS